MSPVLIIGHNDLRLVLRSKVGYIWLFVVPLLFIYFLGSANRGPGEASDPRPAVLIENRDEGFLSSALLDELGSKGMRVLPENEAEDAERGIRIPVALTDRILDKEQVELEFFKIAGSGNPAADMIELRLVRALVALNSHLLETATRLGPDSAMTEEALRETMAKPPPVRMESRFAGRKPVPVGFNQSLPGIMVMYILMNLLIFGGASIAEERRTGVMRRLAVYPVTRGQLVMGKVYGRLLLGVIQIVYYMVLAQFFFQVNVGANPAGVVLTLFLFSWMSASLGVMIGSFTRSEEKTIPICILVAMVMAALGGCWWPMEIVPDTMKAVGHIFPTAWAMDAFHKLVSFGMGLRSIRWELFVLALFGAVANLLAAKFLRY